MSLFSRWRSKRTPSVSTTETPRRRSEVDVAHLAQFVATRAGVEAYVEPANRDFAVSLLLIATTGEWTRRTVGNQRAARAIARDLGIPVYDVNFTGYPQRMRDWNSARKKTRS
ncbi:hypothetical protein [Jonesia denitrificans]|uniref:Uncharacterized protein n=1 Tax=Jonesia denitrificans (strain ATCC 14870 / DSM 20603 / BCRC 15368 / CIP 55.134 / JCM 11481 / NBRC 15587 / NCTC 10816 / Prevot 55134) TaxID=471856 RepID=C7R4V3_JONDD|nr:hypothetical protein [Jonesia denitrificans]ACV09123.1 hypothetical protein Jden_1474 [Jonesia denitrificans DSM 20603]ASE09595.1 oxidoreductase [Jonesia denitrificans]QXB44137.1 oxidoreductase [Jonesia denitrificans]SQH21325.1 Uncharacterised protein [Jonesia denitrificans]